MTNVNINDAIKVNRVKIIMNNVWCDSQQEAKACQSAFYIRMSDKLVVNPLLLNWHMLPDYLPHYTDP